MDSKSRLRSSVLKQQCNSAITILHGDNDDLAAMKVSMEEFVNKDEIKSSSFDNMKQQIRDYLSVIDSSILANKIDINDFRLLRDALGSMDLNGAVILEQKGKAEKAAEQADSAAYNYLKDSLFLSNSVVSDHYRLLYERYKNEAITWRQMVGCYMKQIETYDNVESTTSSLFTRGQSIRNAAFSALREVRGQYKNGTYQPNLEAGWREILGAPTAMMNNLVKMDAKGNVTYDYDKIAELFSKDPESLTDEEYQALIEIYANMSDDELEKYIACAYAPCDPPDDGRLCPYPGTYYVVSDVFKKVIDRYNSDIDVEIKKLRYPTPQVDQINNIEELEKRIARGSLGINIIKYNPIIARDGVFPYSVDYPDDDELYKWLAPISNLQYIYDPDYDTHGYKVQLNQGVSYHGYNRGGYWDIDNAMAETVESIGVTSGAYIMDQIVYNVNTYLEGEQLSSDEIAENALIDVGVFALDLTGIEIVGDVMKAQSLFNILSNIGESVKTNIQTSNLVKANSMASILESLGIRADLSIKRDKLGTIVASLSHVQINADEFYDNARYYLAVQCAGGHKAACALLDKLENHPEQLTEKEKKALSTESINALQTKLIKQFRDGEYGKKNMSLLEKFDGVVDVRKKNN